MLLMVMVAASARSLSDVEWIASINMKAAAGYCLFVLAVFRVDANGRLAELVFYDTNDLGLLIVSTLPFAAYFVTKGHRRGRRIFALLCIPLFLLLLVQTGSRGAFIGLSAVAVYLGLFYRGVSRAARVAGVTFMAAAFIIFGGTAYFDKIGTIFNPTQDYNWEGKSATGRMEIWKRGLGYLGDRPLTGVGIDNFQSAEGKLSAIGQEMASRGRPFKWSVAHNSYLETAAEAGIGALLCFVSLFVATLFMLRRVARAMARLPYLSRELVLAQVLTASIVGYLVCAFFISAEYFVYPYVLLGLSFALAKSTLSRPRVIR
jgi:putative inorganic carbon (HCO3(-)) transporter